MDKTRIFEAAGRYAAKGQLDKAAREYQRILDSDARDVRALQKLAEIHQKNNRVSDAAGLLLRVAEAYSEQGFFLKAVAVYKQVLKLGDERVEVNLRLAQLYQQLGLVSDATQQYQLVANHYDRVGDVKESLSALRRMVDLDPENVASRVKLGELYAREGMAQEAANELRRAAVQLKRQNRSDDHLRVLERIGQIVPDDATTARELAQSFLGRGEPKRALARLQVCFQQNPRDVDTLQLLARAFSELGQEGKSVSVHRELARIYREGGQSEAERRTLQRILELVPGDAEATEGLAAMDGPPSHTAPGAASQKPATGSSGPGGAIVPPAPPSGAALVPPPPPTAAPRPTNTPPAATSVPTSPTSPTASSPAIAPPPPAAPATNVPNAPTAAAPQPMAPVAPGTTASAWPTLPPLPPGPLSQTTPPDVLRILTESDVYLKYGLVAKAAEHLSKALAQAPHHIAVHERVLATADRQGDAAQVERTLARLVELAHLSADFEKESSYTQALAQRAPNHPLVQAAAAAAAQLEESSEALVEPDSLELSAVDLAHEAALYDEMPDSVTIDPEYTASPHHTASPHTTGTLASGTNEPVPLEFSISPSAVPFASPVADSQDPPAPEALSGSQETGESQEAEEEDVIAPDSDVTDDPDLAALTGDDDDRGDDAVFDLGDAEELDEALGQSFPEGPDASAAPPAHFDTGAAPFDAFESFSEPRSDSRSEPHAESPFEPWAEPFEEELAEAEFLVAQGLTDDARNVLDWVLSQSAAESPSHERAKSILDSFAPPAAPAPFAPEETEGTRDIGRELASELGSDGASVSANDIASIFGPVRVSAITPQPYSVEDVLDEFKKRLSTAVSAEDSQTHYDLGIAYKEMGLYDEAIHEFEVALGGRGARRVIDCLSMIGVCLVEKGQPADAMQYFQRALKTPGLTLEASKDAHFEIGRCHELLGDDRKALDHFARVFRADPNFRDVRRWVTSLSQRVRDSARARPPTPAPVPAPTASSPSPPESTAGSRRKIGYI